MADKSKTKLPLEVTPKGVAAYAHVEKPDTKFAAKPEDAYYNVTITFPKDETDGLEARLNGGKDKVSFDEWRAVIEKHHEDGGGDGIAHFCPFKDGDNQLDKNGRPKKSPNENLFGKWYVVFKSKFPPQRVDTKKQDLPDDVRIFGGDVIKVAYRPHYYGEGCTLYFNTVMLIDKKNQGNSAHVFGDDEEGYVADRADADAFGDDEGGDNNGDY